MRWRYDGSLAFFRRGRADRCCGRVLWFYPSVPAPIRRATLDRCNRALSHGVFIDINPAPALFSFCAPRPLQQTVIDAICTRCVSRRQHIAFIGGAGHDGLMSSRRPAYRRLQRWAASTCPHWLRLRLRSLHCGEWTWSGQHYLMHAQMICLSLVAADPLAVGFQVLSRCRGLRQRPIRLPAPSTIFRSAVHGSPRWLLCDQSS